jgi:hypothetical protein
MSYDLDAFPLPSGQTAEEYVESDAREKLALDDAPPTDEQRAAMERAATALLEVDPSAERFDDEQSIELTTDAMQVSLFPQEAAISIPYWFMGEDAEAALARAYAYARVIAETLGYTIWDPQTGQVVDPLGDRSDAEATYGWGYEKTQQIARPAKRPWWKIWG